MTKIFAAGAIILSSLFVFSSVAQGDVIICRDKAHGHGICKVWPT